MRLLWVAMAALAGCAAFSPPQITIGPDLPATILASIPVGQGPTRLAMTPDGTHLYAAGNGLLSVISTASNSVVASLPIDPNTAGITVTPDGKRVLITSLFSIRLQSVDTATNTLVTPTDLFQQRIMGGFARIAVAPDGRTGYVANTPNSVLAVVNFAQGSSEGRPMDLRPRDLTFAPDGRALYVCGCKPICSNGTVERLDMQSGLVTQSMLVGPSPYRIAVTRDGTRAYTANLGEASVSVMDLATQSVTDTVQVLVEPTGLAIAPDGSQVYVTSLPSGRLAVIDAKTNSVIGTVKVGRAAREVVVTPDGRIIYVSTTDKVVALDAQSLKEAP